MQMVIVKGDAGGIDFRVNTDSGKLGFYSFVIDVTGGYDFSIFDSTGFHDVVSGSSPAIHTGLNQPNMIAVVLHGKTLDLYVNGQQVNSIVNSTFRHGGIGVEADSMKNATEVAFSNATVWEYQGIG